MQIGQLVVNQRMYSGCRCGHFSVQKTYRANIFGVKGVFFAKKYSISDDIVNIMPIMLRVYRERVFSPIDGGLPRVGDQG